MGDSVTVTGFLINYRGLSEFTFSGETSGVVVHENVGAPVPKIVNISDVLNQEWNGVERLEGSLVELRSVEFADTGKFEAWKNYNITDGTHTMILRVSNEGILDGVPIPAGKVNVRGIIGQYKSSAPYNSGYQLLPRSGNDILLNTSSGSINIITPVEGEEFSAGSVVGISWFSENVEFVDLHYKLSEYAAWKTIAEKIDASAGRYSWWTPALINDSGYVRIKDSYDNLNFTLSGKIYLSSSTSVDENSVPEKYYLGQNYPNPFNPLTNLNFGLPESAYVSLDMYDTNGRYVKNILSDNLNPGHYTVQLSAVNLASGIYFYQLKTPQFVSVKKLAYVK
jgi:hypothetical protein